ncbi:MAG TPA: DUF58 domain-containing protein [Bryobacteraceae bacterium]|jgi:uncharacterized protein (DUF58 family)|nr:DUF58 domain-containing protein [Bryobacteraceae bacterium]
MPTWILPFHRLRALIQRRVRYRVTLGGVLFLLALSLTGSIAFLSGNNLLFLIFAVMLALLLVSGFLSRLVLSGLELELQLPEHVSARTPTPARVLIRNLKRFTPSFSIQLSGPAILTGPLYFPVIPGRGGRESTLQAAIEIVFPRRGRHRENVFLLSTSFPFGFILKSTTVALHRETVVYPCLDDPQPEIDLVVDSVARQIAASARGTGQEFHSIRAYVSQDDARHVDWKSTAHTGALQVREFARDQQRGVEIHFDCRAGSGKKPDAESSAAFENLVERAAAFAWKCSLRGLDILFLSQNFVADLSDKTGIYDMLVFLALAEPIQSNEVEVAEFPSDDSNLLVIFSVHSPQRDAAHDPQQEI